MPDDGTIRTDRESGRVRLTFFLNDRLLPVLRRIDEDAAHPSRFLKAELLESYLWLHHGVEVGYFPENLSRRVVYEYFPLFLKAHESVSLESDFNTLFTPLMQIIWRSEFTGNQGLFSSGLTWQRSEAPSESVSVFELHHVLANAFAQNLEARSLVGALAMLSDAEWKYSIENNVQFSPFTELESEKRVNGQSLHWTNAGFFAALEFMRAARRINSDLRNMFPEVGEKLQDYVRLLKDTQRWRLNFGYLTYRDRFVQIARIAAKPLAARVAKEENGDAEATAGNFLKAVEELMTDWGAPITKAASA